MNHPSSMIFDDDLKKPLTPEQVLDLLKFVTSLKSDGNKLTVRLSIPVGEPPKDTPPKS